MILKPHKLGNNSLSPEKLKNDKKQCRKFGPCGVGEQAIYLNSFFLDRRFYIPFTSVKRIYKRIAMSRGGFSGTGIFASIPYLVVEYDNGLEQQCNFKREEDIDRLLAYVGFRHPELPLHSKEAEIKLAEKAQRLAKKRTSVPLSGPAQKNIHTLEMCERYLKNNSDLYIDLSQSAKRKRSHEQSNPAYKWVALAITLLGAAALVYGIYSFIAKADFGIYFLLFGFAAIFLFSGASVLPTARSNRKSIEKSFADSINAMESYIRKRPDFPIPAYYAHPVVLSRMADIIREGRAETLPDALFILKKDLKALNSSVMVEQEEYDEIVAIKPMFLVMDYQ